MTATVYVAMFRSLMDTLTEVDVTAPTFIAIASRWCQATDWTEADPVAMGHRTS
jgi:hypothetical protein